MEKKYELIPSDKEGLYRVKALRSFSNVKAGDMGGYVSGEDNLSHKGNCWIYDNAYVRENARVFGHAVVRENAVVCGDARVFGHAVVRENAWVYGNAAVSGDAVVYGDAEVFGNAGVNGDACVRGFAEVHGDTRICGNAVVESNKDYMVLKNWWSSGRYFTWTRSNDMWRVGCFYGSGEELIKKAYADSKLSGKMYESTVNYVKELLKAEQKLAEDK